MTIDLGWAIAITQLAFAGGWILGARYRPGKPVLRPYMNPVLTGRARDANAIEIDPETLARIGQLEELKIPESELQRVTQDIMHEAGVDEATAREEVDRILQEAMRIGQG